MFRNGHMNQGAWPHVQSATHKSCGQSLLALGFPIRQTAHGFMLNPPRPNPILPNPTTDNALVSYSLSHEDSDKSQIKILMAPWFMQQEEDSSAVSTAKITPPILRKLIQKKETSNKFQKREFPDYIVDYEKNETTNRMNRVWTCKEPSCRKRFRKFCSLKDHIRLHKNEAPFPCAYCGRGWSQAGNRDRHQKNASCLRGKKGKILM